MNVLGYDVGRRQDPSALVKMSGTITSPTRSILSCRRLPLGMSYYNQAEIVADNLKSCDMLVMDVGGVGDAVIEIVAHHYNRVPIWGVNITGGKKMTINADERSACIPKASMVEHLVASFEKNHVMARPNAAPEIAGDVGLLIEEMEKFQRKGVKLEATAGAHDDLVMAACLSAMGFKITQLVQETKDGR